MISTPAFLLGKKLVMLSLVIAATILPLCAQSSLFYLEIQAVGSYLPETGEFLPYSHHEHDAMQKPSVGFDYLYRFGSQSRDLGYLSLQSRLAYDEYYDSKLKLQIYNAFVNFKTRSFDLWLGHNKPALGLPKLMDNHALLLEDNSMSAMNYDRDWGLGVNFDRGKPSFSASLTTGSGMPLNLNDSYLASSRMGIGEYQLDNLSFGISAAYGKVQKTMGYVTMHSGITHDLIAGGADFRWKTGQLELQGDLLAGEYHDKPAYSGLLRLGYYFLPEDRALLELQGISRELADLHSNSISLATTYRLNPDLTFRAAYRYDDLSDTGAIIAQLYYYKGFSF